MNTNLKLIFAVLAFAACGCSTTITSPNGWQYSSPAFGKQFSELTVESSTNGTFRAVLKGYKAGSPAEIIDSATELLKAVPK